MLLLSHSNFKLYIMKKHVLLAKMLMTLAFTGALSWGSLTSVYAQASAYGFSQTNGTYTPITGTAFLVESDDENSSVQNIGFNFNFAGNIFTQFVVRSNGFIRLGNVTPAGSTPISSASETNAISPFGRDGLTTGGVIVATQGTAPNRVCVIQFNNYRVQWNGTEFINMQIRLSETTNVIEFVYDSPVASTTNRTSQVGIKAAANDFNNRTTTTNWNASTAGGAATSTMAFSTSVTLPVNGLTFTWTPPASCTGTPNPGNTLSTVANTCAGTNFTLSLQNATLGFGVSYQWQTSPDGSSWTNAGPNAATWTTNQTASTQYRCVVTCDGNDGISAAVTVGMAPFLDCYCAPTYSNGCGSNGGDAITNVQLGTLNNPSGCAPSPFFTFFNNVTVPDLPRSTTLNASITMGADGSQFSRVWVDFNQNGIFEESESFSLGTSAGANGTSIIPIVIPADAVLGITRMRVRGGNDSAIPANAACGTSGSICGEAEDYLVNITEAPACIFPSALTNTGITNSAANHSWTASPSSPAGYEWALTTSATPPASGTFTAGLTASSSGLAEATQYFLHVRSDCGDNVFSDWVTSSFTTPVLGATCGAAIVINPATLPFSTTDNTANYGNNYSSANVPSLAGVQIGLGSNSTSYLNGNDVVYSFTPDVTGCYIVEATGVATWTGLWVFQGCEPFTSTVGYHNLSTSGNRALQGLNLTQGETYYIVISTFPSPQTTAYTLNLSQCPPPPSCASNFVVTPTPGCGNLPLTISWDAVAGATSYLVSLGTTPGGTDIAANQNIGASTSFSFTNPTVSTLYYYTVTPTNAFGSATGCIEQQFTTLSTACYCTPASTSQASWLSAFNTTGADVNLSYSSSAGAVGGYNNQTALSVSNWLGNPTNISLTAGGGLTVGFAIWVDWNNDFTFSAAERMFNTTGFVTTTSGSFSIPAGTPNGSYRMRVLADRNASNPNNPCATITRGEFVDFTFNVINMPSCLAPGGINNVNITSTSANHFWTAPAVAPANGYEWAITTSSTPPANGTPTSMTIAASSGLNPGTQYFIHVRSNCGAAGFSNWSTSSFTTLAPGDVCSVAIPISTACGFNATGTTVGRPNTNLSTCGTTTGTAGMVWYQFTGTGGQMTASTFGSSFDTKLWVYSGACGALTCVGGNDDFGSPQSQVTFNTVAGVNYYVVVGGFGANQGNYVFNLFCTTQLQVGSCGATNVTPQQMLVANNVSAPVYRFRFTGPNNGGPGWNNNQFVVDRHVRYVWFNWLVPGFQFGATYSVAVAVGDGNGNFGPYGPACDVTVQSNVPLTQVQTSQCGATVDGNTNIIANNIFDAQGYRFRITGPNNGGAGWNNDVFILDRTQRYFRFNWTIPGATPGGTFSVEVAQLLNDGVTYSPFGQACDITLSPQTTKIQTSQCGITGLMPNTNVVADLVYDAQGYRFRITGSNNGGQGWNNDVFILDRAPQRQFTFQAHVPGALPGETYEIEVAFLQNDGVTYSAFGTMCEVTLFGAAELVLDESEIEIFVDNKITTVVEFGANASQNPFTTDFGLQVLNANDTETINVSVYDMSGKLIERNAINPMDMETARFGANLASGMYMIEVRQGANQAVIRQVKN